jgi:hypothetical protein
MPYSYEEVRGVLRVTLKGALTSEELHNFITEMEELLQKRKKWPDNLLDLRTVELKKLGFTDMMSFAKRRESVVPPHAIRTALVAESPVITGFARMFQSMNNNPKITVEVFPTLAAADAWLAKS